MPARHCGKHAPALSPAGPPQCRPPLLGNPFVIVYKMSPLSYKLARALVSVEFAGMPNLVAGREVVPELLQRDFTAGKIVNRMRPLLEDSPQRHQMQTDLVEVRHRLTLANGHADPALPNLTVKDENGNSTAIARAADCALAPAARIYRTEATLKLMKLIPRRLLTLVLVLLPAMLAVTSRTALAVAPPKPQLQVLSYAIAAELDPTGHKITAQAQLTCNALTDQNIAVFELHNDLRPTSIVDGKGQYVDGRAEHAGLHAAHFPALHVERWNTRHFHLQVRRYSEQR